VWKRAPAKRRSAPAMGRSTARRSSSAGHLERAREQQRHQNQQECQRRPAHAGFGPANSASVALSCAVIRAAKISAMIRPMPMPKPARGTARNCQVHADDAAGVDQRQDVGRRGEEQEGDRRADARALLVDARQTAARWCTSTPPARTRQRRAPDRRSTWALRPRKRVTDSLGISAVIAPAI
jgi:hypothetical protein